MLKEYIKNANKTIQKDTPIEKRLMQGSIGMTGESAEVMDLVKKVVFQGHEMTEEKHDKIIEEIGDVMWYANLLIQTLDTRWEEVLKKNNDKLLKRYPKGEFNSKDSIERKF